MDKIRELEAALIEERKRWIKEQKRCLDLADAAEELIGASTSRTAGWAVRLDAAVETMNAALRAAGRLP